jgi:hypothetical protein
MECGGKRSATPLWISDITEFVKTIQSAADALLCRRTPKDGAFPTGINPN